MTICIAIKCKIKNKEVLLFASDTQESSAYLKRPTAKIRCISGLRPEDKNDKKIDEWGILVASAGNAFLIDEAVEDINFLLHKKIDWDEKLPSIALRILRKEIGDIAYDVYKRHKDRGVSKPIFDLLIGACDEYSTLLYVTCEGKTKLVSDYGIIGSGQITGGELLLAEFFRNKMTQKQAANLAALVISRVGRIDISVGGLPDIHMCRDRCVWDYKPKFLDEILTTSERRWSILKETFWKMQADDEIENKLKTILKEV